MTPDQRLLSRLAGDGSVPGERLLTAASAAAPVRWMSEHRPQILTIVETLGWVVVRGLDVHEDALFRECVEALGFPVATDYGDLPVSASPARVAGVFDVTPFPPGEAIFFHHEGAHTPRAPRYISFLCDVPAIQGGETPLADSAEMLLRLHPDIREAFLSKDLRYRRTFVDGLDVPWHTYFQTRDPHEVCARCRAQGMVATWDDDGALSVEIRRPAIVRHRVSGRLTFFNQVLLHHPACLDPEVREALEFALPHGRLPRHVTFGDGSAIPDEWMDAILDAYIQVAVAFAWRSGDIALVDNHAVAHGRRPYVGARRHRAVLTSC
jgi:alpha-ketoglutarate-dependent taurine dioxygenase